MNDQFHEGSYIASDIVEGSNQDAYSPVDMVLVHETPVDEIVTTVDPLDEALAAETPVVVAPVQEIPPGGAVAAASPPDETIYREAPMGETLYYKAPVVETAAAEPYVAPLAETITPTPASPMGENSGSLAALLNRDQSEHFRTLWNGIQGKFVDEPRAAVQQADALVSEVVEQITKIFASEHSTLEAQWNQGNDVSTEDLRQALRRYRSFFNRLVV